MSGRTRTGGKNRESTISEHECEAMQTLDRDPEYTRSEIAFMFECGVGTVSRHCQRDCSHCSPEWDGPRPRQGYSDDQLLFALGWVKGAVPFQRISTGVYDDYAPEEFPSGSTIAGRLGGWVEARRRVKVLLAGGDLDAE